MKRSKRILTWLALAAFSAAQGIGLFFLMRTAPATALRLSETALVLKMDEGRRVTHTIEPAAASGKLVKFKVTAPDGIVAWVDEQNEMIVALAPGACQVKAVLDGQEAIVDVTVLDETALAGEWQTEDGTALSIDNDLNSVFVTQQGTEQIQWFRGAFSTNENSNPYRYVKLTGTRGDTPLILYYDRLSDTLRLHVDGAAPDGIFVRGF